MKPRSLGYAHIESTDPKQWLEYGTEVLGLMVAPGMPADDNIYLKMDCRPYRLAIIPGKSDRLALCGWDIGGEPEFEAARRELNEAGVSFAEGTPEECAQRRVAGLLRLDDPAGNTLELYHGADLDYIRLVSPAGVSGFETGFNGDMGFGHAVLPAPNLEETHAFYRDLLGFGDSDYMHFRFNEDPADPGQGMNFMHADNPRHHSLALYQAPSPTGCIHLMIEVLNVDEVGYCLDRVSQKDVPITATLGRHTNDRMLSFYMQTPTGFAMEYGCQGLKMNWENYVPTRSALPSIWGHKFSG